MCNSEIEKIQELPKSYRNYITLEIEKYEFDKEQDCESILEETKERLKYVARIESLGCKVINNHPLDEKYLSKLYRNYMEGHGELEAKRYEIFAPKQSFQQRKTLSL